ncbi:YebC/PmpR family DNA-binding transcriptional regulator [Candidatus Uhrbacteria bacterium]|nr:YebC/PmpR family DNA-binding transcriptional regulator [Candidatus Uhrbacteria bacterium]
MSGHSKWATTKRQKFATDAKRAAVFTRIANAITIAARKKGGNPDMNFSLRLAIDHAKEVNMPKENIDRAMKRGTGELAGEHIEEIMYEGFGPGGVAFLIEVTTNNKNRSVSDIKHALTKYGGNLGSANSVRWMFERRGILGIPTHLLIDDLTLELIEADVLDIQKENDESTIVTAPEDLQKIKNLLEKRGVHPAFTEFDYLPQTSITLDDKTIKEKLEKIFSELEDVPDITHVYSNLA